MSRLSSKKLVVEGLHLSALPPLPASVKRTLQLCQRAWPALTRQPSKGLSKAVATVVDVFSRPIAKMRHLKREGRSLASLAVATPNGGCLILIALEFPRVLSLRGRKALLGRKPRRGQVSRPSSHDLKS